MTPPVAPGIPMIAKIRSRPWTTTFSIFAALPSAIRYRATPISDDAKNGLTAREDPPTRNPNRAARIPRGVTKLYATENSDVAELYARCLDACQISCTVRGRNGPADTPGSVFARGRWTAIYLRRTLPHASSGLPGSWASSLERFLSDLAPGEVYIADRVTPAAGGLLHHRFTLTPVCRNTQWRSAFCCTISRVTPGGCYPPPCSAEPGRSSGGIAAPRGRLADPFGW